jgi:bacteriorhodopsin
MGVGLTSARRVGISRDYTMLAGWLNLLWLLYPIAFGLSDGGNRLKLTSGAVWFGVLDILMIPVIAFACVFLSSRWDYGSLNLHFTQYGRVTHGGTFPEKHAAPAAGGVTTAPA